MSCDTEYIVKGQDSNVSITLYDQAGNTIDTSAFVKLVVVVKHSNGTIVAKYSKNVAAGYKTIDETSGALGVIVIRLLTVHTMSVPEGKLIYEVHGQITDASSTDDSVLDLISTNNYLCSLIASITGGETLP